MGHYFHMKPDGLDGALFFWDLAVGSLFDVRVQRIAADGAEMLAHNGLCPEIGGPAGQIEPGAVFNPDTGEITLTYVDMNAAQSMRGLFAQRFDAAGNRLWGDAGTVLLPRDADLEVLPALVLAGGTVLGMVEQDPGSMPGAAVVLGFGLDDDGGLLWGGPVTAASTPSSKGTIKAAYNGQTMVGVWDDDRNGEPDVFAQNLNADGTLGPAAGAIDEPDGSTRPVPAVCTSYPNPFRSTTAIAFDLPAASKVDLCIYDVTGALVRKLFTGTLPAAHHQVMWDGRGQSGRRLPSGVYYYHLSTPAGMAARPVLLVD
jgi:hypothetical protein